MSTRRVIGAKSSGGPPRSCRGPSLTRAGATVVGALLGPRRPRRSAGRTPSPPPSARPCRALAKPWSAVRRSSVNESGPTSVPASVRVADRQLPVAFAMRSTSPASATRGMPDQFCAVWLPRWPAVPAAETRSLATSRSRIGRRGDESPGVVCHPIPKASGRAEPLPPPESYLLSHPHRPVAARSEPTRGSSDTCAHKPDSPAPPWTSRLTSRGAPAIGAAPLDPRPGMPARSAASTSDRLPTLTGVHRHQRDRRCSRPRTATES